MPRGSSRILKLSGMIDDRGGELEKYRMSEEAMKGMKRTVKDFYRTQVRPVAGWAWAVG